MEQITVETLDLLGGVLCLDFANTVDYSGGDPRHVPGTDALEDLDALLRWGRRAGAYDGDAEPAGNGARELRAGLRLRDALHDLFAAIATGQEPPAAALERLRRDAGAGLRAGRLRADGRLDWRADDVRRIRFAVAESALRLLSDPERLARVRHCPGRNCGWLFLDVSGRRRWCEMGKCGSREKMRRMYARRRRA
jgi:predicted RNA-binding Zn ribbon-like protein